MRKLTCERLMSMDKQGVAILTPMRIERQYILAVMATSQSPFSILMNAPDV